MSGHDLTRTNSEDEQVRARWQSDFDGTAARIPDEWLIRDGDWVGIEAGHCTCDADGKEKYHCPVCLYASLARIGYAMGWLP